MLVLLDRQSSSGACMVSKAMNRVCSKTAITKLQDILFRSCQDLGRAACGCHSIGFGHETSSRRKDKLEMIQNQLEAAPLSVDDFAGMRRKADCQCEEWWLRR